MNIVRSPRNVTGNFTVSGQILAADGSASAPSYSFANQAGMGWWRAGTSDQRWAVNNVNYVRLGVNAAITLNASTSLAWGSSDVTSADVLLFRDAAGRLALRNSTNAQRISIYNTFTTLNTSGEWLDIDWATTANTCLIRTNAGSSSGTVRAMVIQPANQPQATAVGASVTIQGGQGATTGAGGALALTGGTPGSTGAGGTVTVTSGPGGATSGNSGNLILTVGSLTSGTPGNLIFRSGRAEVAKRTATTESTAGAVTYTIAQFLGGLILRDCNGAGRSDVTPTAALMVAGVPSVAVDDTFELWLVNTSDAAETITLTAGSGVTLIPATITVAQNENARLLCRFTNVTGASEAVTVYAMVAGG